MMRRIIFVVAIASLVAACTGGDRFEGTLPEPSEGSVRPVPPAQWAVEAEEWRIASIEASTNGIVNASRFWDEDVVFEDRTGGEVVRGRDEFIDYAVRAFGARDPSTPVGWYLSADEKLEHWLWGFLTPSIDWLDREVMGPNGLVRSVNAASAAAGRVYAKEIDWDAVEALADRWVAVWGGAGPGSVKGLYAADARIDDTLLGWSLEGIGEIDVAATSPDEIGLLVVAIDELPGTRGRAIFLAPPCHDPPAVAEVRLSVTADDGSGCPGRMAVSLGWDGSQVVWERRYHEVESVRRCLDPVELAPGWWEGLEPPDPVIMEQTGMMVWEEQGLAVEIYNGAPGIERFVRWGFERFVEAGLPVPRISAIVFLVDRTRCDSKSGFATWGGSQGAVVTMCGSVDDVCEGEDCSTWVRRERLTLLHEYAHPWIEAHVDDEMRARFMTFTGVDRWNDPADSWMDRGIERAANTIMFGLIEETTEQSGYFDWVGDCSRRSEAFRLLTGELPIASCAPSPTGRASSTVAPPG